jgi:hypothetical protein
MKSKKKKQILKIISNKTNSNKKMRIKLKDEKIENEIEKQFNF